MIPDGVEKRKAYNDLIDRGVQLLREQEQIKEDLAQLKAEVEETIGKDFAKEYPVKVKTRHSCGKEEEKANKKLEIIAELDILEKASRDSLQP